MGREVSLPCLQASLQEPLRASLPPKSSSSWSKETEPCYPDSALTPRLQGASSAECSRPLTAYTAMGLSCMGRQRAECRASLPTDRSERKDPSVRRGSSVPMGLCSV